MTKQKKIHLIQANQRTDHHTGVRRRNKRTRKVQERELWLIDGIDYENQAAFETRLIEESDK